MPSFTFFDLPVNQELTKASRSWLNRNCRDLHARFGCPAFFSAPGRGSHARKIFRLPH